jgi:hypothetical protein
MISVTCYEYNVYFRFTAKFQYYNHDKHYTDINVSLMLFANNVSNLLAVAYLLSISAGDL